MNEKKKWVMPDWMRPFLPFMLGNCPPNSQTPADIECLQNGNATIVENAALALIQTTVNAQVGFLYRLHDARLLKEAQ